MNHVFNISPNLNIFETNSKTKDNEIKLTKKRKLGFDDLIQNLKNKVNPNNPENKNKK